MSSILLKYVLYSLITSHEVSGNFEAADDVMAMGFNWIPPLAFIDAIGGKHEFMRLLNERVPSQQVSGVEIMSIIDNVPECSEYDYRKFFKAKQ